MKLMKAGQRHFGFTIIELMIVIAIVGVLATLAIPSFTTYFQSSRVKGATEALASSLQMAKFEAAKRNAPVTLVFTPAAVNTQHTEWCFGAIADGAANCQCNLANSPGCQAGTVVSSAQYAGTTLNFTNSNLRTFDPARGQANCNNCLATFQAGNDISLGVTLMATGSVAVCRPANTRVIGYNDSAQCP